MNGRRKALIVACDDYEHEGLRHLLSPAADAKALAGVLGDREIGDFDVRVARNEPAHVVQAQIEDLFSESRADDVLLVHFSCHGLKSESGELYFAARNTRPNRLGSTAISANFVQQCMRTSRSRSIVLLLDCCYGGAFGQGVTVRGSGDVNVLDSFPGGKLGGGRGRAVITASNSMEYAFEGDQLADDHDPQPSVFTTALVEGLATGEADRDEDGWVSLDELYDYLFDRVREQNPHQTPSRDVEMQGELYLARSRRRRIRPLPIPPNLEDARTDSNMFTRIGAVTELRARLTSDDLSAAAGAYNALEDTARTDIQYVAEAAAVALREGAVQTRERDLHFGQVAKDSRPVHREIHLLGPPIARACTFQPSQGWIRIEETTDGLDVSVDTSQAGEFRGNIAIKGPTGKALIPVDVEVTPSPEEPAAHDPTPIVTAESIPIPAPRPIAEARQAPQPAIERTSASPSHPAGEPSYPPAPVREPAAHSPTPAGIPSLAPTPLGATPSGGSHVRSNRTPVASIVAGGVVVVAAVALHVPYRAGHVMLGLVLIVYGALRVIQSFDADEARAGRRQLLEILATVSLLAGGLVVANALNDDTENTMVTIVVMFWLVDGPVQIVGAIRGGSRPTRGLEIVSAVLAVVGLSAGIVYLVRGSLDNLVKDWLIIFGATLILVGFRQRSARRGLASSESVQRGPNPDPPSS